MIGFVAALLVLAALGWRALSLGAADFLARSEPAAAMRWRPGYAEAALRAFETGSAEKFSKVSRAVEARQAIRSAPLDGRGYWWLARIAEASGNASESQRLHELSAQRGPRNVRVLGWLADLELRQGQYRQGIRHIDQLLRVQPELSPRLGPVVFALAAEPNARGDLVAVLSRQPPWRADLMPAMLAQAKDIERLYPFLDALQRQSGGLSVKETNDWIERLAHDRNWGAAYIVWTQSLAPDETSRIGNVFNGGFESEPSQSGFDWRFESVVGAHASRTESVGEHGGHYVLQVEFEDRRVPFRHVRQLLALAPGHFRLSGRAKLEDLRSERGLVWKLACAETGRALGQTEPMSGRTPWHGFATEFDVPAENCGGQWLSLEIPARIPAEQLVGGTALFDDLKIKSISKSQPQVVHLEAVY